jgi:hypothetical protein
MDAALLVGDPIKLNGKNKRGEVAAILPNKSILVRWSNGKTEVVSPALISWYYPRKLKAA